MYKIKTNTPLSFPRRRESIKSVPYLYRFRIKSGMTGLLLILFLTITSPAHATPVGLSIDPPLLKVQIKPGKSITKAFNLENKESVDKDVVVRLVPFTKSDRQGNPIIDLKSKAPWLTYLSLSNSTIKLDEPFLLKANSKEQLILSLAIPETANLEDLYLTLLVSTYDNSLTSENKGTFISATIGSNIIISVTSSINPNTILKIEKIIPISGSFLRLGNRYFADNLSPLTFTSSVANNGQFVTETKGTFKVSKKSETIEIQGILPQLVISKTSRDLTNLDGKPFFFNPSIKTIGSHTVNINIKSENTNSSNSIEVIFLPVKIILGIFLAFATFRIIVSVTKLKQ